MAKKPKGQEVSWIVTLNVYLAGAIFLTTLMFVIWQPRGLSIGWSATAGALLALATGVVHLYDVWTVWKIVWDATFAFLAIIIISKLLDEIGFFEWAALKMGHAAKGNGRLVFLYVVLLGAAVSAFFGNDGAALILTPIVLEKVKLLRFELKSMLPFIFASGFIADTTSLPLVVSNLVNIVSADYFHIGFIHYAVDMAVPDLISLGASVFVLYVFFYKRIPKVYQPTELPQPTTVISHQGLFRASWWLLGCLCLGYILTELLRIPVSVAAGAVGLVFLLLGARTKSVRTMSILKEAPWGIVVFSLGMYLIVYGLQNVGLTAILGQWLAASAERGLYASTLFTGFLTAVLSSVMNNLPSVMIGALAIHSISVPLLIQKAMVYANVVGCDLGPKMTPIGSLATLLWLHILAKRGIRITWGQYFRVGIVLTVPTLFVTLTGLYLWIALLG